MQYLTVKLLSLDSCSPFVLGRVPWSLYSAPCALQFVDSWEVCSEAFASTLMPAYDLFVVGCCLLHGLMIRIKGARQSSHPLPLWDFCSAYHYTGLPELDVFPADSEPPTCDAQWGGFKL